MTCLGSKQGKFQGKSREMPEGSQNVSIQGNDATGTHGNSHLAFPIGWATSLPYLTQTALRGDLASRGLTRATGSLRRGEVCIALGGQSKTGTHLRLLTAVCKPPRSLGGGCRGAEGKAMALTSCEPPGDGDIMWWVSLPRVFHFLSDLTNQFGVAGPKI